MFEQVDIANVRHERMNKEVIALFFTANDLPYSLWISCRSGVFYPQFVIHHSNECCPFCDSDQQAEKHCFPLTEQRISLFHRLINDPSIRLEWLFLKHEPPINHKKSN